MSKRTAELDKKVDKTKFYSIDEAVKVIKETAKAKFDESVDVAIRLNVDVKQADQNLRGAVPLPNGSGKKIRVCVIAKGEKMMDAKNAGAETIGGEDIIEKIQKGWMDFDVIVATPDMMQAVSKLGRLLGPKGLMPNPKTGTVTFEVGRAIKEIKLGRAEYRTDATGIIHSSVGKASFEPAKLAQNIKAFLTTIISSRPATVKGQFVKSIAVSTTMGPGIPLDPNLKISEES